MSDETKTPQTRPGAGGFRFTKIGPLLGARATPAQTREAAGKLREMFVKHHTLAEVARRCNVDRTTVERWIRKLSASGLDPRKDLPEDDKLASEPETAPVAPRQRRRQARAGAAA